MKELREERLRKLEEIKGLDQNPYPAKQKEMQQWLQIIILKIWMVKKLKIIKRILLVFENGKISFIVLKGLFRW